MRFYLSMKLIIYKQESRAGPYQIAGGFGRKFFQLEWLSSVDIYDNIVNTKTNVCSTTSLFHLSLHLFFHWFLAFVNCI